MLCALVNLANHEPLSLLPRKTPSWGCAGLSPTVVLPHLQGLLVTVAGEDGRGNGLWPTQLWSIYINRWAAKSELGRKPPGWELAKNRLTVVRLWACVLKVLLIWIVFRTSTENLPGECFQSFFSWSLLLLCSSQLILWFYIFFLPLIIYLVCSEGFFLTAC